MSHKPGDAAPSSLFSEQNKDAATEPRPAPPPPPKVVVSVPSVRYADISGETHSLGGTKKPALLVFWNANTPSFRAMKLLAAMRPDYPENTLDIIGFYTDEITTESLSQTAQDNGYFFTIASAAQTPELKATLLKSFNVKDSGQDIYVIDKADGVTIVDISNPQIPDDVIVAKLNAVIKPML
jgi:hypothetical protein